MIRRLQKEIETVMNDGAGAGRSWLHTALGMASLLYGWGVKVRGFAYANGFVKPRALSCAVISIGNLTVGGTGKTPMTIYMARLIRSFGLQVAVLSRGYGGRAEKTGGVVCDGRDVLVRPETAGDEPFMMATLLQNIPVLVGGDRFRSGQEAVRRFRPDVILLDDAFQHRRLARDMDIVLMDAERPLGNGRLFPRGVLREGPAALSRCHAVVFTRADHIERLSPEPLQGLLNGKSVFTSCHEPYVSCIVNAGSGAISGGGHTPAGWLRKKRVYAFSGIARNDDFRRMLERFGCTLGGFSEFPDHHRYTQQDIEDMTAAAGRTRSACLVTTEKDYFRISGQVDVLLDLAVVGVKIQFKDDAFDRFVKNRLTRILGGKGILNEARER